MGEKIVVITGIVARERNLRHIGYYKLRNKRFEVWDISKVYKEYETNVNFEDEVVQGKSLSILKSKKSIKQKIEKEGADTYYWLSRMYKENKLKKWIYSIIEMSGGSLLEKYETEKIGFESDVKVNFYDKIEAYWKYLRRLAGNLIKKRFSTHSDYIFIPTKRSIRRADRVGLGTKIRPIHTIDYDRYLESKNTPLQGSSKPYAVFLDQYIPFHHELENKFGENWVEPKKYYEELKNFFSRVVKYNDNVEEVKIALHPNAKEKKINEFIGGIDAYKNKTPELVRGSKLVLTHMSTSTLFAVMDNKPICVFSLKSISKEPIVKVIKNVAKLVGVEVNFGPPFEDISYGVHKSRYKKIMENYVKSSGTPKVDSCVYMYEKVVGEEVKT